MRLTAFIKLARKELLTARRKDQLVVWSPVAAKAASQAARGFQRAEGPPRARLAAAVRGGAMSVAPIDIQGALSRRSNQLLHTNARRAKKLAVRGTRKMTQGARKMYRLTESEIRQLMRSRSKS